VLGTRDRALRVLVWVEPLISQNFALDVFSKV
jgi:hypothetical protein